MRNSGLNWVLLLMLVWAGQSLQYACRQTKNCGCWSMASDKFEIWCSKDSVTTFLIKVESKELVTVKCDRRSLWSDFELNSTGRVEDVQTLRFDQCSMPDSTLYEISRKIGVQPMNTLRFRSYKHLNSTLKRHHLTGFPKLKELSLNSNGLTDIPADLLTDLPNLIKLELGRNIVSLPLQFFDNVPKLEWLELGGNNLMYIEPSLIRGLEWLTYLGLYGNKLTHLRNDTFEHLSKLKTLEISKNKLTTLFPEVFKRLRNLSVLRMSENYFSSLPKDLLSENLNLRTFELVSNRGNSSTLPSRFLSNLTKLTEVYLANNELEVLPEDIFWGSHSIKKLELRENSLSTLPLNIFNETTNLELLDLSSNRLNYLPDGLFGVLTKLEKLELQDNNLTFISKKMFSGLSGLKEINLERNGLGSIASSGFTYLQGLQVARLSHNQLTLEDNLLFPKGFRDHSPFHRCIDMRELHLAHNNITTIFSDWAFLMQKLQYLDLRYNQISTVSDQDFQFLSQDIIIDITHNNINKIHLDRAEISALAQDFPKTPPSRSVRILIDENPILCDCDLYAFLKYLNGAMHPDVQRLYHILPGSLKCHGPGWMHHTRVSNLNYKTLICPIPICPEKCECWVRRYDMTAIINCSYRSLRTAPERIVSRSDGKVELDLTGNFLTEVPFINQTGYGNISKLLLSHNNISVISPDNIPPEVEVLELHNNNLTRLDSMVLDRFMSSTSLKNLTLHENPWKCDRQALHFTRLSSNIFIPNLLNVTCETGG